MSLLSIIIPAAIFLVFMIYIVIFRMMLEGKFRRRKSQKREYFRVDVPEPESFTATLELDNGSLIGCKIMNVGIGGVGVLTVQLPITLEQGSTIKEIMISFPGGAEVRAPAVVRYIVSESDDEFNRYGIQFTNLTDEQRDIIARYVLQTEAQEIKQQRTGPEKGEANA